MSLDALKNDIDTRSFRRLYYFCGPEPYLKRFYLNSLIGALLPDNADTDLHRYEGKELTVDVFSEELWLFPLGEYKALMINDLSTSSPVAEFLSGDDCEIPEDTVVIVYQQTEVPDARTGGYRALKKRIDRDGLFVEIRTVDDNTLARWVTQQFQRRGCTIGASEVAYFLSVEERNMESMLTEIDKIAVYCGGGTVSREALEKLCVKTVQARAYELNDLILQKDSDKVFALWSDLRALKTPPQMILGSLFSCFAGLYRLKELEGVSLPEKEMIALTGIKQGFLIRRYAGYLKKIPPERLDRLIEVCSEIDVQCKSTSVDAEVLVVRLLTEALEIL